MVMTEDNSQFNAPTGDQQHIAVYQDIAALDLPEITVENLLLRARQSIESGVSSFRAAAEYLAAAQELGVSQRQLADEVGKSPAWVNALLKWREHGYPGDTPFKNRRPLPKAVQQGERDATDTGTSDQVQVAASGEPAETAKLDAHTPAEDEVVEPEDHDNDDAFGDNRIDMTFSSVQRARLIEALELLGSDQVELRASAALAVKEDRATLGMQWDQLLIPAKEAET